MANLNGYTDWYAVGLQNHGMGLATFAAPLSLLVGLSSSTIAQDGTGATEPAAGVGYARASSTGKWAAAVAAPWLNARVTNNANIEFGISTGSWGLITYFAVYDGEAVPNMYWGGALSTPKTIETDTIPIFTVGALSIESVNTTP